MKKVILASGQGLFWDITQENPENRIVRHGEIKELTVNEVVTKALNNGVIIEAIPSVLETYGLSEKPVEPKPEVVVIQADELAAIKLKLQNFEEAEVARRAAEIAAKDKADADAAEAKAAEEAAKSKK
jgi:hypothetical protein